MANEVLDTKPVNMFEQVVEDLKSRESSTERVFFKLGDVSFETEGGNKLVGKELNGGLSPKGFENLCDTLGIPVPYAKRCPPSLVKDNVNFWLKQRKDVMHSALVEGDKVRAFMPAKYPYVPTYDILQAAVELIPEDFRVGNYYLDDQALEAVILTPEFDQTIIDSPVYGGIRIVHSDSWGVFPRFDTYLLREICTNGMTSPISHKKFRVSGKSADEILGEVRGFVNNSMGQLPEMFKGFVKLHEQEIANFVAVISKIVQENKLPKKLKNILVDTAGSPKFSQTVPQGKINTMHNLVNLLTYVGSHDRTLSEDHREHLLSIAGNIALTGTTRCGSCGGSVE